MNLIDRAMEWYWRLTTPRKISMISLIIILTLWAGGARESNRKNQVMQATSKQVQDLETQMREEMRHSSELHGRILQRLERLEKMHQLADRERDDSK